MTEDPRWYEHAARSVQPPVAAAPAPTPTENAITAAADAGPVLSGVSAVHGVFDEMRIPGIADDVRGVGGVLSVLSTASSAASTRNAMQRGDASGMFEGGLGVTAGLLGAASAVAPWLTPAAQVAGIGSTAYTMGSALNNASGEALEYLVGGQQERTGRGVGASNEVRTDNRRISDRLADGTRTSVGDSLALRLSPYLPVAFGGEGETVQTGPIGRGENLEPSSEEINAMVIAESRAITEQRHQSDLARGGGHRGEDVRARHPEIPVEEEGETSIQHMQRVQRELAAANRRSRLRSSR